jgi:hypothetical protein
LPGRHGSLQKARRSHRKATKGIPSQPFFGTLSSGSMWDGTALREALWAGLQECP